MALKYTVKEGDTLNDVVRNYGFENYKTAGVTSVPSGNFDLIRPGEEITINNYKRGPVQDTSADYAQFEENSAKFDEELGTALGEGTKDRQDASGVVTDTGANGAQTGTGAEGAPEDQMVQVMSQLEKDVQAVTQQAEQEIQYAKDTLDGIKRSSTAATQALIDSIERTYDQRIAEMQMVNTRLLGGKRQAGIRSGRARYTSDTQKDILAEEERAGISRIAQLEGEKLSLIAEAEQARTDKDIMLFNSRMQELSRINKDMQSEVKNLQTTAYNKLKEIREQEKAVRDAEKAQQEQIMEQWDNAKYGAAQAFGAFDNAEQQLEFIEALSEQTGIDSMQILSGIYESLDDQKKRSLDMQNIESQILDRERNREIREYQAQTTRMNAQTSQERLKLDQQKNEIEETGVKEEDVAALARAGVPKEIHLDIQASLQQGVSKDAIIAHIAQYKAQELMKGKEIGEKTVGTAETLRQGEIAKVYKEATAYAKSIMEKFEEYYDNND